jgi:transposase-like protein
MKNRSATEKRFKKSEIQKMTLKGKPACPYCRRPLTFVYSDVEKGHLSQKCGKCGKTSGPPRRILERGGWQKQIE